MMHAALILLLAALCAFCLNVPLRMVNDLALNRDHVPVTMGVPLPQGAFSKAKLDTFALFDAAGNALPTDFSALNLWEDTLTVRWLLLSTQVSLKAGETSYVYLTDRKGANDLSGTNRLSAVRNGDKVAVITGPLKFTVRAVNFNGVDSAWVDESGQGRFDNAHLVVGGNTGGFAITLNGAVSRTSTSGAGTIEIEESSPLRTVILVKGRYGPDISHFTRIYAYYNKSYVRIYHTFVMDNSAPDAMKNITRLSLDVKSSFGGALTGFIPGETRDVTFPVTDSASIHQRDVDLYRTLSGASAVDSGRALSVHSPLRPFIRTGWAALGNGSLGLSGGISHFWEMYPKAVELKSDGTLSLCLYKQGVPTPERLFSGMARTHELFLNFFEGAVSDSSSLEANGFVRSPLYLIAPPRWYCGQTQCTHAGLTDSLSANFNPVYQVKVRDYFKNLSTYCIVHLRTRRAVPQSKSTWSVYSGYGFVNFGDEFDEAPIDVCTVDNYTFGYDNNYYDFPYAVLMNLYTTGSPHALTLARENCTHMMDIDHNNWHQDSLMSGACRQCYGMGHVRTYDASCLVYHSPSYNHWKCESAFELYHLTGDRFFLDRGMALANYVVRRGNGGMDVANNPRSAMSSLGALVAAYRETHQQKYLDAIYSLWTGSIHYPITASGNIGSQAFMQGLAMEGMAKAAKLEPNPTRAAMYKADLAKQRDHTFGVEGGAQEGLWAAAYSYSQENLWPQRIANIIGDFGAVNVSSLGNIHKYAESNRAIQHFFQYLTAPTYNPFQPVNYLAEQYVRSERKIEAAPAQFTLACYPVPFNPLVHILLNGGVSADRLTLKIYDAQGGLIDDLTQRAAARIRGGAAAVEWDAAGRGAGVYFVKATQGDRMKVSRIALIK